MGVITPKSPPKNPQSTHASEKTTGISSPRQIRAGMKSKHLHDVDASGVDKPVDKQLKRKGKELRVDDDFVEDSLKLPTGKKPKVSPSTSKQKKKPQRNYQIGS